MNEQKKHKQTKNRWNYFRFNWNRYFECEDMKIKNDKFRLFMGSSIYL